MSLISAAIGAADRAQLPDRLARMGSEFLVGRTRRELADAVDRQKNDFARTWPDIRSRTCRGRQRAALRIGARILRSYVRVTAHIHAASFQQDGKR